VRQLDLQDRRFLARWMPQLEAHFHYRNLDVSSQGAGAGAGSRGRRRASPRKASTRRSPTSSSPIEELKYYRKTVMTI